MLLKYLLIAVTAFVLGVGSTLWYLWAWGSTHLRDDFNSLQASWSSDNKDWASFANWLDAGGRGYWFLETAINGIQNGMSESEIRFVLGAPDLVVVGAEQYKELASIHQLKPVGSDNGDHTYIPSCTGRLRVFISTRLAGLRCSEEK